MAAAEHGGGGSAATRPQSDRRHQLRQEFGHGVRVEPGPVPQAVFQRGRVRPGEEHDVPGRGEDGKTIPGRSAGREESSARGHSGVFGQQGVAVDENEVGQRWRHTPLEPRAPGHAAGRRRTAADFFAASGVAATTLVAADGSGPSSIVVIVRRRWVAQGRFAARLAHWIKRQAD